MNASFSTVIAAIAPLLVPTMSQSADNSAKPARELAGLWQAKRRFGPDVRGTLVVHQSPAGWRAEIAGRSGVAKVTDGTVSIELPDGYGSFRGKFSEKRDRLIGHWIQPRQFTNGTTYASPVVLNRDGADCWRGEVVPLDDEMTLYLMVKVGADGSVGAFVKNPERNAGRFFEGASVVQEGKVVRLVKPGRKGVLAEGAVHDGLLSLYVPGMETTFDFRRVKSDAASDFYPRGRPHADYVYAPPPDVGDGWPTSTLDDEHLSRSGIEKFVQSLVDTPIDSVHAQEVHAVLIARHGRLVLEEYFHGEHREKPHDTRSAAKSLTATLVGAAIHAGVPLDVSTPVYRVMNGGSFPAGLEARKQALTVEHLLTMSSGLDCDDRDPASVGNEDTMQEQTAQPDWYRYTLDLRMVRDPGEKAVYGSANPNLLGGVLARAAGRPLPELFHDLIAEPLGIKRYHLNLTPTGDAYLGGGARFLPRDFMKLGQLMLNGGTWNGRPVVTPEWCRRATAPRYDLAGIRYGYLWWISDFPYKGRTVRAFFAGGNGGQAVIGIPELELLVAFYGGNYSDPATYVPQRVYVPKYILPTVDGGG
jgi:CubicO group peptidase (beta-lactamase class C family)